LKLKKKFQKKNGLFNDYLWPFSQFRGFNVILNKLFPTLPLEAEQIKRDPFLDKSGKIMKKYEEVLEECANDPDGLYNRYQKAVNENAGDDLTLSFS